MKVIGVTSLRRRGYVAAHRGYIAPFRGYVARQVCKPLWQLVFLTRFCLLPFFYLLPTWRPLWTSRKLGRQGSVEGWPTRRSRAHSAAFDAQRQYAPASGGINGASRLDVPLVGRFSVQPDRPCGPPLSPRLWRGSPCGSIRARGARNVRGWSTTALACREGPAVRLSLSLGQAPSGRVRLKAKRRGEPVGGCGTPANEPALSTPSRGGQRSHPRAGAGVTIAIAQGRSFGLLTLLRKPYCGDHDPSELSNAEHSPVVISTVPKSCRSLVQTACRTRGGSHCFSHNNDMRRHGELWLKQYEPQPLRGRGA